MKSTIPENNPTNTMVPEPLSLEPMVPQSQDWHALDHFLKSELRPEVDWSLRSEYPLALSEKNINNIRIIKDPKNNILSHAVLKPCIFKTHLQLWKVGIIGSVCTASSHRKMGLGRSNVEACLDAATSQGCQFTILWTHLYDYYKKMGFQMAGREVSIDFYKNKPFSIEKKYTIRQSLQVSSEAILSLFNNHSLRSLRTGYDIQKYLKIPKTSLFTAWDPVKNKIMGYAVVGRGADFENYIHEWGGNVSALIELIHEIQGLRKKTTIIMPPESQNLRRRLKAIGGVEKLGLLGMMKINNPFQFAKKVKQRARRMGHGDFVFEYREGSYYFGLGNDIYQTQQDSDIIQLTFGPWKPKDIHKFSDQTMEKLETIFPMSFWVWGWDTA